MTAVRPLDRSRHKELGMAPVPDAHASRYALLGLSEIPLASVDFPLCFAKDDETGRFDLIALLSLDEACNLYWLGGGWRCTYVPDSALIDGFRLDGGPSGLAIDEENPRFGEQGQPLFNPDGSLSPAVQAISTRLRRLSDDLVAARSMAQRFAELDLMRALELVLTLPDGKEHELSGLYGLSPPALAELADRDVVQLFRTGHLAAATLICASLNQLERLVQLRAAMKRETRSELGVRLKAPGSR